MTVGNMENAQLFDAGKKGRGLRATKEFNTGEVIFAEPSYSAVVFDRYAPDHASTGCCSLCIRWTGQGTCYLITEHVFFQILLMLCRFVDDFSVCQLSLGYDLVSRFKKFSLHQQVNV